MAIQSITTSFTHVACMHVLYHALIRTFLSHSMNRNLPLSSVQLAIQPEQASKNTLKETLSTAGDLAKTIAELTAVVADILHNVPYVKGIAGTLAQIIKMRDVTLLLLYRAVLNSFQEMKFQKERCGELINKILRCSHKLFLALREIGESPNQPALSSLEQDLKEYFQYGICGV